MSRPLRIQYPDAWYHVMNRGRRGEQVFETRKDYLSFIDLLEELDEIFNVRIAAYCLMPNHYHLLLQTEYSGPIRHPIPIDSATLFRSIAPPYSGAFRHPQSENERRGAG